eukprot:9302840-Pyramimonas_sp.AAC.2
MPRQRGSCARRAQEERRLFSVRPEKGAHLEGAWEDEEREKRKDGGHRWGGGPQKQKLHGVGVPGRGGGRGGG